jgi:hypothetical protein
MTIDNDVSFECFFNTACHLFPHISSPASPPDFAKPTDINRLKKKLNRNSERSPRGLPRGQRVNLKTEFLVVAAKHCPTAEQFSQIAARVFNYRRFSV